MQINLDIKGLTEAQDMLAGFSERRLNAAMATAITRTAVAARAAASQALSADIDRPTPYTSRQLRYTAATAARPTAEVGFNIEAVTNERGEISRYVGVRPGETPASRYLQPQIAGGERSLKRFEKALQAAGAMPVGWKAVPGAGARLDAFGNINRGQLQQIISQVGTELTAGHTRSLPRLTKGMEKKRQTQVKRQRREAFGRAGGQFIALPQGRGKLKPGVYLASGRNFGAKWGFGRTGRITPVLVFVRSVSYRQRYDFYGIVNGVVAQRLAPEAGRALAEHIARLRNGSVEP